MRAIYGFVYLVRNRVSGKVYVGQTTRTVASRWSNHVASVRHNSRSARMPIVCAIRKYGPDSFDIVELGRAFSADELNDMERRAIWTHSSTDAEFGYNIEHGGNCVPVSTESRRKQSENRKGQPLSAEHRATISRSSIGKKMSPEACAKMSEAKRNMSDETRAKIGAAGKGRKLSDVTRAKMSEWRRGRRRSDVTRKRLSEAHTGKKLSDETRAKISATRIAMFKLLKTQAAELIEKEQWSFQN